MGGAGDGVLELEPLGSGVRPCSVAANADEELADSRLVVEVCRNKLSKSMKEGVRSFLDRLSCRSYSNIDAQVGSVCVRLVMK